MFLLTNSYVLAESPSASNTANKAAGKTSRQPVGTLTTPESFRRRSSFLMRNVQGICPTIFAFHGGATRPSTMAKMPGLISREDIMMREIT
jgi:hypothetical protein